jgi:hypothetical protein
MSKVTSKMYLSGSEKPKKDTELLRSCRKLALKKYG